MKHHLLAALSDLPNRLNGKGQSLPPGPMPMPLLAPTPTPTLLHPASPRLHFTRVRSRMLRLTPLLHPVLRLYPIQPLPPNLRRRRKDSKDGSRKPWEAVIRSGLNRLHRPLPSLNNRLRLEQTSLSIIPMMYRSIHLMRLLSVIKELWEVMSRLPIPKEPLPR